MSRDFETQYNKSAHDFHEYYLNQEAHQSTDAFFASITDDILSNIKNKNVLDLGCGAADDSSFYVQRDFAYYGIDASKEMSEMAKQNKNVTEVRNESFSKKITFEDDKFGLVVSKYAIQSTENIGNVYAEAARLLEKGGYFIYLVVHPIRQFLEKKKQGKDYYKQETVTSNIFDGKISVLETSHTLSEYLNKDFLERFSLIDLKEGSDFPASEQIDGDIYPTYLILVARKK